MRKRTICILLIVALLVTAVAVTAAAAGSTSENEREVYEFLTGRMGASNAVACGIMANIYYETGFRADLSVGTYYGLFMYYGPLANTLRTWCSNNGQDYTTVQGQMEFFSRLMNNEISGYQYGTLWQDMMALGSSSDAAYQAGAMFCRRFERPANVSYESDKRGSYASSTLYPKYQNQSPSNTTPAVEETAVSYTAYVTASALNVRSGPGTGYGLVSSLARSNGVSVVAEATDGNGTTWCKRAEGGWVCGSYLSSTQPSSDSGSGATHYVTASGLNVRSGAGLDYGVVNCLYYGTSVKVTDEATDKDGTAWGKVTDGWVCKSYLASSGNGSDGSSYRVTASGLNVRSGAGTENSVIGCLWYGTNVSVVDTGYDSNGELWGQLASGGWIHMQYVA